MNLGNYAVDILWCYWWQKNGSA